jgi:hypothetical protein
MTTSPSDIPKWVKPCVTCKWARGATVRAAPFSGVNSERWVCAHPKLRIYDRVTGRGIMPNCYEQRRTSLDMYCTTEGIFWEKGD